MINMKRIPAFKLQISGNADEGTKTPIQMISLVKITVQKVLVTMLTFHGQISKVNNTK